jgi:hypothetical protein
MIEQVEPHILERLDLDLSPYGLPTSLNQLVKFKKDEVEEMN